MKKIIRLTESELQNIVKASVKRILKEDVLGDNWNVSDDNEESVYNNYEPFEDQETDNDWGVQGEKNIDPTEYGDFDQIADYPESTVWYKNYHFMYRHNGMT